MERHPHLAKILSAFGFLVSIGTGVFLLFLLLADNGKNKSAYAQTSTGLADTPWPMYQHDAQRTGRSPFAGPVHQPELLWTDRIEQCANLDGGIYIQEDGSLLNDSGGCVMSYDPVERKLHWAFWMGRNSGKLLLDSDQNIYVGFGNAFGQILPGGEVNWDAELSSNYSFGSGATFGLDGNLYVVHDALWSFTPLGELRWNHPFDWFSQASPAIGLDGSIYAPSQGDEDLCAYSPDGSILWCQGAHNSGESPAVGADGTVYIVSRSGSLRAVDPSGVTKWTFDPASIEAGSYYGSSGMAIASDGSITFKTHSSTGNYDAHVYRVDQNGNFQWKVTLPPHPLTGRYSQITLPLTTDRNGNIYLCSKNSFCYGINPQGKIMWEIELPLVDSLILTSHTQPLLAADGLLYFVDGDTRLYAYSDPELYPQLTASAGRIAIRTPLITDTLTTTLYLSSTVQPITFTTWLSGSPLLPEWVSFTQREQTTPATITLTFRPGNLLPGIYSAALWMRPAERAGKWIETSLRIEVSNRSLYLPLALNNAQPPHPIIYWSNWFTEYHLAFIEQTGQNRSGLPLEYDNGVRHIVYSPDGQKAAFERLVADTHRYQIDIIDIQSGKNILVISDDENSITTPVWGPDSNQLMFYSPDAAEETGIYRINLDGSGLQRILDNPHRFNGNFRDVGTGLVPALGQPQEIVSTDSGVSQQIPEGPSYIGDILWALNGNRVALDMDWSGAIYIMNADGSNLYDLFPERRDISPVGWSPDGRYLLFTSEVFGHSSGLNVYDFETQECRFLANKVYSLKDYRAIWSPDGKRIAFAKLGIDGVHTDIYVINADGSNLTNLTGSLPDREEIQPAWSPDSRWIAFASREMLIDGDQNYDIYIVRVDGAHLQKITTNLQLDAYPFWYSANYPSWVSEAR